MGAWVRIPLGSQHKFGALLILKDFPKFPDDRWETLVKQNPNHIVAIGSVLCETGL